MTKILKRTIFIITIILTIYIISTAVIYNINKKYNLKDNHQSISYQLNDFKIPENTPIMNANINYFKGFYYVGIPIKLIIPLLFLFIGIVEYIEKLIKGTGNERIVKRGIVFYLTYTIFSFIITLPIELFNSYVRLKLIGISNKGFLEYFISLSKETLINCIILAPTIWIIYYIYKTRKNWYIHIWILCTITMFVGNYLYPYYERVTNNTKEINNKEIVDQLQIIEKTADLDKIKFKEIEMSSKTSSINAYLSGMFNSRQIVIWDTAISKLPKGEFDALVAHEIGHYINEDILKEIIFTQAINFFILYFSQCIFNKINKKNRRRNREMFKIIFIINVLFFMVQPLKLAFCRYQEINADNYAMDLLNSSQENFKLELRLISTSIMPIDGEGALKWLYYTHPSPKERIENCIRWKEKNKSPLR